MVVGVRFQFEGIFLWRRRLDIESFKNILYYTCRDYESYNNRYFNKIIFKLINIKLILD